MKPLRIRITNDARSCAVDADELLAWSRALLDRVLFEGAVQVSQGGPALALDVTVTLTLKADPVSGDLVVEG